MGLKRMDLNCDLGEGEPVDRTDALCRVVDRINVACGGHAGDEATMVRCVGWARERGLVLGAHPGLPGAFGRGEARITRVELGALLREQVGRLRKVAEPFGMEVRHVKLHGSLYHAVERDEGLASAMAEWMNEARATEFPDDFAAIGLPTGALSVATRAAGVRFLSEGFLDRGYRRDGTLVARGDTGALLDLASVVRRLDRWREEGCLEAVDGTVLTWTLDTLCVHGDSDGALAMARAAACALRETRMARLRPGGGIR
jgi:UPF0271 protein